MLQLPAPPPRDQSERAGGALLAVVPMLGSLGSVALLTSGRGAGGRPLMAVGILVLVTVLLTALQLDRHRAHRLRRTATVRSHYLDLLSGARRAIEVAADGQRRERHRLHPEPAALAALAEEGSRVWERTESHPEFLHVRIGTGPTPLELHLAVPDATGPTDLVAEAAMRRLVAVHSVLHAVPSTLDLKGCRRLALVSRAQVRAIMCAAATFHAPAHLRMAVLCDPSRLVHWDWVKWLPHALSPRSTDAVGPRRLVGTSYDELVRLLPDDPTGRLLLVVDGVAPPDGSTELGSRTTVLEPDGGTQPRGFVADECPQPVAEALARRLPRPPVRPEPEDPRRDGRRDHLRVPIGTTTDGGPVHLDLKESAEGGAGPHGLLVGATGSGKSELLRTLVLELARRHSPDELTLALVDFKGGATFADLARLPHVSALITNLDDDLALVDRMREALSGEVQRRQQQLHADGGHASVRDHETARAAGASFEPMPSLLVVVDEFSELLSAKPEFAELFVTIGRLGRSLGIHLLLASQRLDEGRLRGLEAHLAYRIALRTFSELDSRSVLGVPDAHELSPVPGLGLLRAGPGDLTAFRATFVSAPSADHTQPPGVLPYAVTEVGGLDVPAAGERRRSVLEDTVDSLVAAATSRARRIWLPPLDRSPTIGDLIATASDRAGLVLPLGVVDRPREQRRDLLSVDLGGSAGHLAVVGGPRSGKSTLLCTVVAALALTRGPLAAQVFLVDLGGGVLTGLAELPHVAAAATSAESARVRRLVGHVAGILDRREASLQPEPAQVFLVVDGWGSLSGDYDDLAPALHRLAQRGLASGIHLVVASGRWTDFRPAVRDQLGGRLELRLGDPLDSDLGRQLAAQVPADRPGRGLVRPGHHFLAAVPVAEGGLVQRARDTWVDVPPPALPELPLRIGLAEVREAAGSPPRLLLGIDETALAPVALPAKQPHLLVLGEPGSGRTALLRTLALEIARTRSPVRARIVVVDPRRTLLDQLPDTHLVEHLTSGAATASVLGRLATELAGRRSDHEVHVLVDDHDLVSGPVAVLAPLLALGPDNGLRLVVARRTGGALRALYEPVLQTLQELGAPGLLLAGAPDEGPLLGLRPAAAPPGRARLVTRERGVEVVQLAWTEPM